MTVEHDRVGGPRHYSGPEGKGPIAWRCPACGGDNQTPLLAGCPQCGSGKPGQHVGVDPIVRPEDRHTLLRQQQEPPSIVTPRVTSAAHGAYAQWKYDKHLPAMTTATDQWLFDAFRAGWAACEGQQPRDVMDLGLPEPAPTASPAAPLPVPLVHELPTASVFPGTAKERTLLAALTFFRSSVVPEAGEEMATGEWLALGEIDEWIAALTETLNDGHTTDTVDDASLV